MKFLPIDYQDMVARNWSDLDFVVVTGDAYVDHPSFGAAIISRILEAEGFRVGILAQPQSLADYKRFGEPRLGFLVTGGNIDTMVSHYTVAKRRRQEDAYSPGGKIGLRPDRATIVYANQVRAVYPDIPIIIGGLEGSLRRFAHYDYWDNKVRQSIVIDSQADLLVYGMGEKQILEIARLLDKGANVKKLHDILGTCYAVPVNDYRPAPCAECPSFEAVSENSEEGRKNYAISARIQQDEQDHIYGKRIIQRHGDIMVVQNPPMPPISTAELDRVAELPYVRDAHPIYEKMGGVGSIEEVKFSLIHNRGCFGACNFCSIAFHQGRHIATRSEESLLREAEMLTQMEDFKGYIHDVGGPTANFRSGSCARKDKKGVCKGKKCLAPNPCPSLKADHSEYLRILKRLRNLPRVKKVFIRSGIRFDYLLLDKDEAFFKELIANHVSGQLKVAPEHCSANVLYRMGKPSIDSYKRFKARFYQLTKSMAKKQYLVPYLMSSHPGSTLNDAVNLAVFLKEEGLKPEQVQDFYPTPGTIATAMFYTGLDPYTLKKVYVPKTPEEKAEQRALLQYFIPQNRAKVLKALKSLGRTDLIGNGKEHLVRDFENAKSIGSSGAKSNQHSKGNQSNNRKNSSSNKGGRNKNKAISSDRNKQNEKAFGNNRSNPSSKNKKRSSARKGSK